MSTAEFLAKDAFNQIASELGDAISLARKNISATNYTLVAGDALRLIVKSTGGTITIPAGVIAQGVQLAIMKTTSAAVTIEVGTGVVLKSVESANAIVAQYQPVTLYHAGEDGGNEDWWLFGVGSGGFQAQIDQLSQQISLRALLNGDASRRFKASAAIDNDEVTTLNQVLNLIPEAEGGVENTDQWQVSTDISAQDSIITTNLIRNSAVSFGRVGSGMSETSGVFTFPRTGYWSVAMDIRFVLSSGSDRDVAVLMDYTANNGAGWDTVARATGFITSGGSGDHSITISTQAHVIITNTAQQKVRFRTDAQNASTQVRGGPGTRHSMFTFIRFAGL